MEERVAAVQESTGGVIDRPDGKKARVHCGVEEVSSDGSGGVRPWGGE